VLNLLLVAADATDASIVIFKLQIVIKKELTLSLSICKALRAFCKYWISSFEAFKDWSVERLPAA